MAIGAKRARRGSFMLSIIHKSLNDMLRYYKSKMCEQDAVINLQETINLVENSNKPKKATASLKGKKAKKKE